ncbi:hypothetical protein SAMN06298226_1642 [Nitrosovibrio sp. Nv4]|nr:hypothetical protein SAMN06298226_1642 [Nitrosovibrio sp. Nv4]
MDLLEMIRAPYVHAARKHGLCERGGFAYPDEYADQEINRMDNVTLIQAISDALNDDAANGN